VGGIQKAQDTDSGDESDGEDDTEGDGEDVDERPLVVGRGVVWVLSLEQHSGSFGGSEYSCFLIG
jgi:hypothetical protein